jgi:hypothetical protein
MNPPFGAICLSAKTVFEILYPAARYDMYAGFVQRGVDLLELKGLLGSITSRTCLFLWSFQRWREEVLFRTARPRVVVDLGHGVMDGAMVEAAAYCLEVKA